MRSYTPERAPEEFKRVREAYETLSDPATRKEYENRLDPAVERLMESAFKAMNAESYEDAERQFKQALLHVPELHYARNMLGLCLLYKGEATKAITQFERLLQVPEAPSTWYGNAGVAYHKAERYRDAESAFGKAIAKAIDNPVDYIVALADVYLDQKQYEKAVDTLEKGIALDGTVDFQDLRYFTKLLEVRIWEGDEKGVSAVLHRLQAIELDEEERRFVAFKLGMLSQQLLGAGGASFARPISTSARFFQPDDPDYFALERVAQLLKARDFKGTEEFVAGHKSFGAGGWLNELGGKLRKLCAENRVFGAMKPIDSAPALYTLNGCGTTIYGSRDEDAATGSHIATLYFVLLFIPIFPIASYRVIPRGGNSWSFLGRVPFADREKWHVAICILAVLYLVFSNGSSSSTSSGGGSSYTPPTTPYYSTTPSATAAPPQAQVPFVTPTDWYASDKANVESLESAVTSADAMLRTYESDIEGMKSQIRAIEGGYGAYSTSDPAYSALILRHNNSVDLYNTALASRKAAYARYKEALDAFNRRVDEHNARSRP